MTYQLSAFLLPFLVTSAFAAPSTTSDDNIPDITRDSVRQVEQQTQSIAPQSQQKSPPQSMTVEELQQQPELLQNALDTAIAQLNIENIRFLLPLYRKLPIEQQDSTLRDYAQALINQADGKYDEAEHELRTILQNNPEYAPIRLQLAQNLSQNGQQKEAAQELQTLQQTPDLPEGVQQYLEHFNTYLKKERAWKWDGNMYYLSDNNVGNAPRQRTYGFWRFAEPRSAHGLGYDISVQKTTPIKGHWAARVNVAAYGKFYWDAHDYDDLVTHAEIAAVWRNAKNEVSFAPYAQKRWFGTEAYSKTLGGMVRYSHTLSPKWRVFSGWQSGYTQHDTRKHLNGVNHAGSLTFLYQPDAKQYFVMGIGGGYNSARDLSDAYHQSNGRLGWTREWGKQRLFTTSLNGSIQRRFYREADFFNIKRRDTETSLRLSLSHKKLSWKGFTPRLNWHGSQVKSNHFYYRQKNSRIFIDVSKQW